MDLIQSINFLTKELNLLKKKKILEIVDIIKKTILNNNKEYICGSMVHC